MNIPNTAGHCVRYSAEPYGHAARLLKSVTRFVPGCFFLFLILLVSSCRKPELHAPPHPLNLPALSPDSVVRVHWLGKKRLGVMASAYYVTRVWELPETKRVEAQTLEKLSTAPWRFAGNPAALQNAPAFLLRPLLDDVVLEESYFEIRQAANQPEEIVFAIRLDEKRAGIWRTNLVAVIASLAGIQTMDVLDGGQGWALKRQAAPERFELSRVGSWTVLGIGGEKNRLLTETVEWLKKPTTVSTNDFKSWVRADFDLERLKEKLALKWELTAELPRVAIAMTGDGGNVLSRAQLTFAKPLGLKLDPWSVPTNLIHEPLISLTAIRGTTLPDETLLGLAGSPSVAPPRQVYVWSLQGGPLQTYLAIPMANSQQHVEKLSGLLMEKGNPWLTANGYISFERSPDSNGVMWGNLPTIRPFLRSVESNGSGMLYAGLIPETQTDARRGIHPELLREILGRTNLVAYNWESSAEKVDSWLNISQFVRLILRKPQFPLDSPSTTWLRAVVPRLGEAETIVTQVQNNQLSIERKATLGLTGIELNLLVDWLESPQFPRGLYSTLAPLPTAPNEQR